MPDRIEEIKARLAKATPGPWVSRERRNDYGYVLEWEVGAGKSEQFWCENRVGKVFSARDQDAITHAPEDIAYLLAELEAARAVVEAAKRHDGCDQYDMDEFLVEYDRVAGPPCPCPCQPDDDFCTCPWECDCKQRWAHGQVIGGGQP